MQPREHVDLAKMAITAMMVTLVLGALLSLFFFLYTQVSKASTNTEQIIITTSTDKLSDLCNASNSGEMPWVTSVINAISEVDDTNLLYIQVTDNNVTPSSNLYFTYNDITLTGVPTAQVKQSRLPIDECCKYLLNFSNKRCAVQYLTDNDGTSVNSLKFDCLQITVLKN